MKEMLWMNLNLVFYIYGTNQSIETTAKQDGFENDPPFDDGRSREIWNENGNSNDCR